MAQATPFDPHRTDPAYLVSNEKRTIPANIGRYRVFIPNSAPFFRTGLVIKNGAYTLKEGKDFYLGHQFMRGSHQSAQMMYGSIYIVNAALTGEFALDYHKVGDDYTVTPSAALQHLLTHQVDPTTATWEDVIGERYVPPVDIGYDIDNWRGESALMSELQTVASTITSRPTTDDDFYQVAKAYVDRLATIIEYGSWRAHGADKSNPHHSDYIEAGALKSNDIAVNTSKVGGKTIAELMAMVHATGVTADELLARFPLAGDRSVTGPLVVKDGLSNFGYRRSNGTRRFAFHLKRSNVEFSVEKSVNVVADAQANHDGATAYMKSGANVLEVVSSGSSQDGTKLRYNGYQVYTEETIGDAARGAVSTDSKIYTLDSATLHWSGSGRSNDPLSATVKWPAATAVTAGIVKLSSRLDSNDSTVAATASAVKALAAKLANLIPTSRTVGGYPLTSDITLDKEDFGLGNVSDLADANLPVNANHQTLLDTKSTTDHVHNLNDFNYTHATTSVSGIYRYSFATDSSAVDVAVPAVVAMGQYSATIALAAKVVDKVPTNLLDMVQFGGGGYLPIPAVGSYQASGPNNAVMTITSFIHPDGTFVGLRNGADVSETGVFYMYGKIKDSVLQNVVTTTTRYAPKGIPESSFVSRAGRASDTALLFALKDGSTESLCLALLNGTMNAAQHTWCYADLDTSLFGERDIARAYPFVHQGYCYIASLRNWMPLGVLTLSLFRAPVESVAAGGHVSFERVNLSGFDIHGDARSGTEFVVIASAMTTVDGGKALILNKSGGGSSNNIFHSNCCSSSFYNDNGVLKMFFGSQGNQYYPGLSSTRSHSWDVDIQVNLNTGEVTNPTGLANTQIVLEANGSIHGGLLGGGTLASGTGGWDWESGLDVSNGQMVSWRGHWAHGWYIGATTSASGKTLSQFFNAGSRDLSHPAELRIVNSFGSQSHDYLHSVAFGEGNYIYGRNITDWMCWRAKVTLYGDNQFAQGLLGFGPTAEREEVSWVDFGRQKNHITYVDGDSAISLGGIIRTGALNAKVNFADTVQVSITQAQHDALLSAMRAAAGAASPSNESLTLFIPSDINLPPVGIYQYTVPNATYKTLNQYVAMIDVSARSGALATLTLGAKITHRKDINTTVNSTSGVDPIDTGSGIMKTSDGKYLYVINAVNRAYYMGWLSCFGVALIYNPTSKVMETVLATNHDNAYGPNGALVVPRFGRIGLKTDNSTTAILAAVYGFDSNSIKAGTVLNNNVILHSSQVTAGWKLYFTEPVKYFVGGKIYPIAAQGLNLETLFPGDYQNSTFYIYADISNGTGVYSVSKTKLADTATRTLVGTCTTGSSRILTLSVSRVTNIFNLRNLIDHFGTPLQHGLTEISKAAAGLNLVQNQGLYEELSQLGTNESTNYASALLAMKAGYWGSDLTMLYGTIAEGGVVPLPAGFTDAECLIFVLPSGSSGINGVTISTYGIMFNRATRTLTLARAYRADGTGFLQVSCVYTVIASKRLPAHIGAWSA